MRAALTRILTAVLTVPALCLAAAPGATAAAADPTPVTPIHHLVVMMQDHHSFDSYFGTRAGVDGLPAGVCVPEERGAPRPCVAPYAITPSDPRPTFQVTAHSQLTAIDAGRMDGFVYAQATATSDGSAAMGHYLPQDVPIITALANSSLLFDNWFSSVPGGTVANRLFAVSARSQPDLTEVPVGGWKGIPLIFDRLQAAGVPWRIYVQNYDPANTIDTANARARRGGQLTRVPALATSRFVSSPSLMSHIVDLSQYYVDLDDGTLPAVSYIVSTTSTERPPADPDPGQRLVRNVVNALGASTAWPSSAFLLGYDSSGGWYDHVPPGTSGGEQLGPRVPALLVSPYAAAGAVDHTEYDSAAVLKFIERNWSLAPLGGRDEHAADLTSAFTFNAQPRPATLIGVETVPPPPRPDTFVIYLSYLVAAGVVVAVLVWAVLSTRRQVREQADPA